ncbi:MULTISPECIES: hypothetical protein [unclassified Paenibacillus]|uniref:hypothetical protein n=1 Tax=unclassified Paenibacillus TaxID=185978 RepID=UPI0012FD9A8A|nr:MULTISPECIES: hypothetical protein [unclassified Paenibacillus]QID16041.1 hypothetical protein CIC07_25240 [Paenibacillus sp. RUD330]
MVKKLVAAALVNCYYMDIFFLHPPTEMMDLAKLKVDSSKAMLVFIALLFIRTRLKQVAAPSLEGSAFFFAGRPGACWNAACQAISCP